MEFKKIGKKALTDSMKEHFLIELEGIQYKIQKIENNIIYAKEVKE